MPAEDERMDAGEAYAEASDLKEKIAEGANDYDEALFQTNLEKSVMSDDEKAELAQKVEWYENHPTAQFTLKMIKHPEFMRYWVGDECQSLGQQYGHDSDDALQIPEKRLRIIMSLVDLANGKSLYEAMQRDKDAFMAYDHAARRIWIQALSQYNQRREKNGEPPIEGDESKEGHEMEDAILEITTDEDAGRTFGLENYKSNMDSLGNLDEYQVKVIANADTISRQLLDQIKPYFSEEHKTKANQQFESNRRAEEQQKQRFLAEIAEYENNPVAQLGLGLIKHPEFMKYWLGRKCIEVGKMIERPTSENGTESEEEEMEWGEENPQIQAKVKEELMPLINLANGMSLSEAMDGNEKAFTDFVSTIGDVWHEAIRTYNAKCEAKGEEPLDDNKENDRSEIEKAVLSIAVSVKAGFNQEWRKWEADGFSGGDQKTVKAVREKVLELLK